MGIPAIPQQAQMPGDAVVVGGIVAFWVGYLPATLSIIISIMSMVWLGMQIYTWLERRRESKRT